MKLETAKQIVEASDGSVRLYKDYSGRGMCGATTAGVTGKEYDIVDAAEQAGVKTADFRWDSMGLDMIAY